MFCKSPVFFLYNVNLGHEISQLVNTKEVYLLGKKNTLNKRINCLSPFCSQPEM